MKKKRFTEEQIAYALAQESTGQTIAEICRKLGVSEQTFYRWKKKFGSMGVAEVRRLKQLDDGNAKLKRLVADLSLDKAILQDALRKKSLTPGQRRGLVGYAREAYRVTERRACRVLCASRATIRYVSVKPGQEDLRMRPRLQHRGNRRSAPELGLAADPRAAAPRGLAGQPQADGAPVSPGRPESEAESTSA